MEPLSKYLEHFIDELDESRTASELATDAIDREKLMETVEGLFGNTTFSPFTSYHLTRKIFANVAGGADVVEFERDLLEFFLDDCLSRLFLSEIPRMVSRALQLEPMLIKEISQIDENSYLREATRCYLYGLFNASVSLSRSALEQAFSNKVPKLLQKVEGDNLLTLIKTAESSILKRRTEVCESAHRVRKTANLIVHGKACKGPEAFRVLKETRDIVLCLYSK